jgi:hypothetical protein
MGIYETIVVVAIVSVAFACVAGWLWRTLTGRGGCATCRGAGTDKKGGGAGCCPGSDSHPPD